MKQSVDPKVFIGLIVLLLIVVVVFAWKKFGPGPTQMTASEAGLGKPLHPGEIPGKTSGVNTPLTPPGTK